MSSDARLLELEFLSRLARCESLNVSQDGRIPWRDMIVHLLMQELVNDVAGVKPWTDNYHDMVFQLVPQAKSDQLCTLAMFLAGQQANLRISHKGRVRMAELEQAIKTGREREPFGILFNGRHWERDLRIALLSASKDKPVALCFLDMNGLKSINDSIGHGAGDEAIRTYLRVVAANVEEVGDAYRCGGDKVILILPGTDIETAEKMMSALLKQLGEEKVEGVELLTASCGIGVAAEQDMTPKRFRAAVDAVQYEAKAESKAGPKRRSVLAIVGRKLQMF